jgi:hypothetical protein
MSDIDELIDQHGEQTVRQAFWLQEQIYEEGLSGIDFTGAAEDKMDGLSGLLVKNAIEDELPRTI